MAYYYISRGQLITTKGLVPNPGFIVDGNKLIFPCTKELSLKSNCLHRCQKIDAAGLLIAPGFIDLHVHGAKGFDFLDGSSGAVREIAAFHAKGGTTSLLATIAPSTFDKMKKSLSTIKALTKKHSGGSIILGAHLEGPYINPNRAGAINPAYLCKDIGQMDRLISVCGDSLKMVTVAPELPGCINLIKVLSQKGIIASAGHSEAGYDTSLTSFKAGIKHAVHIFNASAPFHHREPGMVGAVITSDQVNAEIIADGLHLHPCAMKLLTSAKGKKTLTLATDAVCAAGLPDGEYEFNDQKINLHKRKITLADGSIAGSCLTMAEAVKNITGMTGIPLHDAVLMASLNPARILGMEKNKGTLADGMDADIVLLDQDINVCLTIAEGRIVFNNSAGITVNDQE